MVFQVSPGINVSEFDQPTSIQVASTTTGGIGGVFRWGPVNKLKLITNENELVSLYGKPTNYNAETWFTAANFLAYGSSLQVSRGANTTGNSNTVAANTFANSTNFTVVNSASGGVGQTGISVGDIVYGPGVPVGTVVSVANIANATTTNTIFTVSKAITDTTNGNFLIFASPNTVFTAIANNGTFTGKLSTYIVKNEDSYDSVQANFAAVVPYVAKYPGAMGNSLKVSVCDTANQYSANIDLKNFASNTSGNSTSTALSVAVGANTLTITIANTSGANDINTTGLANNIAAALTVGDYIYVGNSTIGYQYVQVNSTPTVVTGNTSGTNTGIATITVNLTNPYILSANISMTNFARYWQYYNVVSKAPSQTQYQINNGNTSANDELHVVVVDRLGLFSGVPETVLEVFDGVSRATDSKTDTGADNYYKNVINKNSRFIWWGNDRSTAVSNTALYLTSGSSSTPLTLNFNYGSDGDAEGSVGFGPIASAYDQFADANFVDVNLILGGKSIGGTYGEQLGNYLIDNIASARRDCMVFLTTPANTVVANSGATIGNEYSSILNWGNAIRRSSYAFLTTGYKYQYDKYNDLYRWVPDNGDIGGTCVRTDFERDPWWSPAGYNRGQIKNIVKLAYNPKKQERDILYQAFINPVITTPGLGTVLFGDKTHTVLPSSFDRINVRRLFIVLEKAIANYAKSLLFEFNDEFTRAQFVSLVVPFLRDIQGRRGIYDFRVVCDETNNTPVVIDRNEFIGDIYVKPARSINYIQLNFVAVRTGVAFEEIVGQGF